MGTGDLSGQAMDRRTADMGTAPIGPLLLRMSIPGMVSMIVMSLYDIVDTIWVSGLPNGTESIAALTVVMSLGMGAMAALTVVMSLGMGAMALGMGAGSGVTSLASRRFGESKLDKVLNGFEGKDCHIVWGSNRITVLSKESQ